MNAPKPEHISTERLINGGYRVTYLVNGIFEPLYYHGYTRAEAERLAKIDAHKIQADYYIVEG